jgi:peptidase E
MAVQIMLGPQSPRANLKNAIESLAANGPIVTITAGWRDSEAETNELQAEIGGPIEDLNLYHRAEKIFALEPKFHGLHRERQEKLLELQRLYRIRLTPTMAAARKLLREKGDPNLLRMEQRAAISQVRALDRHHARRISAIHQDFDTRRAALVIPSAAKLRHTMQRKLADSGLVLIAGGHVAVLINRIRLFRLTDVLAQKPIIAWSAGAMVLGERIVLFHDDAPQGKRNAEILDAGLGIVKNIIPLPHAKSRLDWSNRTRMSLFSRRFAPASCCTLDNGSMIHLENNQIISASRSSVIMRTGRKKPVKVR